MEKKELDALFNAQERKDRKVIMEVYNSLYGNESMVMRPTLILEHHDLETEVVINGKYYRWNTEIKAFSGDYKLHLIKKDKLDWVLEASKDCGAVYAIINADTETIYFYDLKEIDWSKLRMNNMYLWVCETDHSRGKTYYWTYFFPRTLAKMTVKMTPELILMFKK